MDSGVNTGSKISVYYDSMLAKVITWGKPGGCPQTLIEALNGYHIEGVSTNIDFANQILTHPVFIRGDLSTDFIPTYLLDPDARIPPPGGRCIPWP